MFTPPPFSVHVTHRNYEKIERERATKPRLRPRHADDGNIERSKKCAALQLSFVVRSK